MEKYEDSTKDITNYEYEKAEKKLRLIRNEFTTTGKFDFVLFQLHKSIQSKSISCLEIIGKSNLPVVVNSLRISRNFFSAFSYS